MQQQRGFDGSTRLSKAAAPMAMKCAPQYYQQQNELYNASGFSANYVSETYARGLNTHNNFLTQVGHTALNLKNNTTFKIPKGYSELSIHVFAHEI